ncbi:MAG: hypothetical protein PHY88_00320 [Candidatus Omnitrophica bacterium]|nr:hypothetical protein [Candidatus Omnitrophota bacterium]
MKNDLKDKWFFKPTSLVIGFLLVGPFILPLIWTNPGFTNKKKTVLTIIILALSCLLFTMAAGSLKYLTDSYQQLNSVTF